MALELDRHHAPETFDTELHENGPEVAAGACGNDGRCSAECSQHNMVRLYLRTNKL